MNDTQILTFGTGWILYKKFVPDSLIDNLNKQLYKLVPRRALDINKHYAEDKNIENLAHFRFRNTYFGAKFRALATSFWKRPHNTFFYFISRPLIRAIIQKKMTFREVIVTKLLISKRLLLIAPPSI